MAGSLRHDELAAVRLLGEGALQFLPLRLGLAFLVGVDAEQLSGSLVCKHDQRKIRRDGRQIAELPERGLEPIDQRRRRLEGLRAVRYRARPRRVSDMKRIEQTHQ